MRPPPLVQRSAGPRFFGYFLGLFGLLDLGLLVGVIAKLLGWTAVNHLFAQTGIQFDFKTALFNVQYTVFMPLLLYSTMRQVQRIERLRQAAAGGAGVQIALERDFQAGKNALIFYPMVIRTRDKNQRAFNLILVCVTLWTLLLLPVAFGTNNNLTIIALVIFAVMIVMLFFLLVIVVAMTLIRARMEVTPVGITLHKMGRVQRILWQDVRLFARQKHRMYEISSATVLLTWQYLQPKDGRISDLPWETYQQQMDALLWLIAAQTGLPLYDLG